MVTSTAGMMNEKDTKTTSLGISADSTLEPRDQTTFKISTGEADPTARNLFGGNHSTNAYDALQSSANDENDWAMPEAPTNEKSADQAESETKLQGGAYAFLDQDDEIEIKIEPIENHLKFSNLEAVNTSQY